MPRVEKRTALVSSVLLPSLTIIILRHSLAASSACLRLLWVSSRVALLLLPLEQECALGLKHLEGAQHALSPRASIMRVV